MSDFCSLDRSRDRAASVVALSRGDRYTLASPAAVAAAAIGALLPLLELAPVEEWHIDGDTSFRSATLIPAEGNEPIDATAAAAAANVSVGGTPVSPSSNNAIGTMTSASSRISTLAARKVLLERRIALERIGLPHTEVERRVVAILAAALQQSRIWRRQCAGRLLQPRAASLLLRLFAAAGRGGSGGGSGSGAGGGEAASTDDEASSSLLPKKRGGIIGRLGKKKKNIPVKEKLQKGESHVCFSGAIGVSGTNALCWQVSFYFYIVCD